MLRRSGVRRAFSGYRRPLGEASGTNVRNLRRKRSFEGSADRHELRRRCGQACAKHPPSATPLGGLDPPSGPVTIRRDAPPAKPFASAYEARVEEHLSSMPDQPAGYGLREFVNTANLHAVILHRARSSRQSPSSSLSTSMPDQTAGDGLRKSRVAMRRR